MSVCVTVRTDKAIEPNQIFDALMQKGEKIITTSSEWPVLCLGTLLEALRGIEISKQEGGYEVRVCAFASKADYALFPVALETVMNLTAGKAFVDDFDGEPLTDFEKQLGKKWLREQRKQTLSFYKLLALKHGKPIGFDGFFFPVRIGAKILHHFDIFAQSPDSLRALNKMEDYLVNMQWNLHVETSTRSRMAIEDPNDKERQLSCSMITYGKPGAPEYDLVEAADLLVLFNVQTKDFQIVPYEYARYILPYQKYRLIDETQVYLEEPLTEEDFPAILARAKNYTPQDIYYDPTFPGEGLDEAQRTFILMWNPAISNFKLKNHNADIPRMLSRYFSWSVWEHQSARMYDRFYLVRCGEGNTGVVMSGIFSSMPVQDEDWSGKGRETFYMDLRANAMLNPDEGPLLTTAELEAAIPSFNWRGDHSGRLLNPEEAAALEKLWAAHLKAHRDEVDGRTFNAVIPIEKVNA